MAPVQLHLGAHCSFDRKHPAETFREAKQINANAIQIFIKPPRKLFADPFVARTVESWRNAMKKAKFNADRIFVHSGYLINVAKRGVNTKALIEEARMVRQLGLKYLVIHPGVDTLNDYNKSIGNVVHNINVCLERVPGITILLETMYKGKIGETFEELASIIKRVKKKARIGVCMDTAHMHMAGYFIHTPIIARNMLARFNRIVGSKYLKCVHINNTLMRVGSRRDEHMGLTVGRIPVKAFQALVSEKIFTVPMILETHADYKAEIKLLRSN